MLGSTYSTPMAHRMPIAQHPPAYSTTPMQQYHDFRQDGFKLYCNLHFPWIPNFPLVEELSGPDAQYLKHIGQQTQATVHILGKYDDPGRGSPPLQIIVLCSEQGQVDRALQLVGSLIATVTERFCEHSQQHAQQPSPAINSVGGYSAYQSQNHMDASMQPGYPAQYQDPAQYYQDPYGQTNMGNFINDGPSHYQPNYYNSSGSTSYVPKSRKKAEKNRQNRRSDHRPHHSKQKRYERERDRDRGRARDRAPKRKRKRSYTPSRERSRSPRRSPQRLNHGYYERRDDEINDPYRPSSKKRVSEKKRKHSSRWGPPKRNVQTRSRSGSRSPPPPLAAFNQQVQRRPKFTEAAEDEEEVEVPLKKKEVEKKKKKTKSRSPSPAQENRSLSLSPSMFADAEDEIEKVEEKPQQPDLGLGGYESSDEEEEASKKEEGKGFTVKVNTEEDDLGFTLRASVQSTGKWGVESADAAASDYSSLQKKKANPMLGKKFNLSL